MIIIIEQGVLDSDEVDKIHPCFFSLPAFVGGYAYSTDFDTHTSSSLNLDGQLLHFRAAKHVHYTELPKIQIVRKACIVANGKYIEFCCYFSIYC